MENMLTGEQEWFFRNGPTRVQKYGKPIGTALEYGGFSYELVPSIGKYVSQMLIRIAADTPEEMKGHLDAFNEWAHKTPLL